MGVISVQLRFEERKQARFGYRMSRLTLDSACVPANAERIMEMCQSASVEMLTLRVPTDKVALVEALEFRIMDCLVYYECPTEYLSAAKPSTLEIREATVEDATAVAETVRLCFSDYSSHYHADAPRPRKMYSSSRPSREYRLNGILGDTGQHGVSVGSTITMG